MLTPRVLGPFVVFVLEVFVQDAESIEVWKRVFSSSSSSQNTGSHY
jgi:hypothetical protein